MSKRKDKPVEQEQIVVAALAGDETAFQQLYEEMYGTLGAVVFNMLDKRTMVKEGASDLIQDAFTKAWEKRHQLKDQTLPGFQRWLIQIIRNLARDKYGYWRAGIRNVDREQSIQSRPENDQDLPAEADSSGEQRTIARLWRAMDQLPAKQREAIRLQKFENWKLAQIAQRLQCSEAAVQGYLRRGKQALAEALKEG